MHGHAAQRLRAAKRLFDTIKKSARYPSSYRKLPPVPVPDFLDNVTGNLLVTFNTVLPESSESYR